jgi:hypothetical protein
MIVVSPRLRLPSRSTNAGQRGCGGKCATAISLRTNFLLARGTHGARAFGEGAEKDARHDGKLRGHLSRFTGDWWCASQFEPILERFAGRAEETLPSIEALMQNGSQSGTSHLGQSFERPLTPPSHENGKQSRCLNELASRRV